MAERMGRARLPDDVFHICSRLSPLRCLIASTLGSRCRPFRQPTSCCRPLSNGGRRCGQALLPHARLSGRFAGLGAHGVRTNTDCSGRLLEEIAMPDADGTPLLLQAADTLGLSAWGFLRTFKVARTLDGLEGADSVGRIQSAQGIANRNGDGRAGEKRPATLSAGRVDFCVVEPVQVVSLVPASPFE